MLVDRGIASRLGADEFALSYPFRARYDMEEKLTTICEALDQPYSIYELSMHFSASVGVSVTPYDSYNAQDLLNDADIAAHRVKRNGGNGLLFYMSSMAVQLEEKLALERNMRLGLQNNEFCLQYQPQVDLGTGKIVGVEALLRWTNAELGAINPSHFIPLAEHTGFILPLGDWVMEQACQQLQKWQSDLKAPLRMAINVSASQFHNKNLTKRLKALLTKYCLDPQSLELEITETSIFRDVDDAIQQLKEVQQLGISVALDDFGTGYSSLSYLKAFKVNYLKIDQSFIRDIPNDTESMAIVSAIIAMAEKLSIKTIAEGVETQGQYNFLRDQGCNIMQGYFCSPSVDCISFELLLKNSRYAH
jgi:predicted signal transduction protein with EAL and GGDEF domain